MATSSGSKDDIVCLEAHNIFIIYEKKAFVKEKIVFTEKILKKSKKFSKRY